MTDKGDDTYEIYAFRYATNGERRRGQNFISDPRPEELLRMDFFSWVLVGAREMIVVDTGMERGKAEHHGHTFLKSPADGLRALGIQPEAVKRVILTHAHYDHIGNVDHFPAPTFMMPSIEMVFATGPDMRHYTFRRPYMADEVGRLIAYLYEGRLVLHGPEAQIAPGISVHVVGGHTAGQEIVRVRTRRGWVVLASDALHYYEEIERSVPFAVAHNVADMMNAHDLIRSLADSDDHIIPAHDPRLMSLYPAAREDLEDFVVRLDVPPIKARI